MEGFPVRLLLECCVEFLNTAQYLTIMFFLNTEQYLRTSINQNIFRGKWLGGKSFETMSRGTVEKKNTVQIKKNQQSKKES